MSETARRIAELQRELGSHPGSRQFYQLGELLRREGRSAEAAETLRAGLAHHPRYVAAWVALGRAYVDSGQASEAVQSLEQALALDRQNPVAWRLLGEACLALGDRGAALEAWRQSLELVPGDDVLQAAVEALKADTGAPPPAAEAVKVKPPTAGVPPAPGPTRPTPAPVERPAPGPFAAAAPDREPAPTAHEAPPAVLPATEPRAPVPPIASAPPRPASVADTAKLALSHFPPAVAPPSPAASEPLGAVAPPGGEIPAGRVPGPVATPPRPAPPPPVPASPGPRMPLSGPDAAPPEPFGDAERPFATPGGERRPEAPVAPVAPAPEPERPAAEPQPPATLALARLYVQQQALDEAQAVLQRLLEREPGNVEARDLLSLVKDMMEPLPEAPPPLTKRERKIAALQHWLACLTLGRERAAR